MKDIIIAILFFLLPLPSASAEDIHTIIYQEALEGNGDTSEAEWIAQAIFYASELYAVDPLLIASIMEQESCFHLNSTSTKGAIGLMQLMPDTASMLGINPHNPLENVIGGTAYLRSQLDSFSSWGTYGVTYAVAAYNAGGQAVRDYGGVPPYRETHDYIHKVSAIYQRLLSRID